MDLTAEPILIWGAGAIGGTVAAYLSRAGLDVSVVDANVAHVRAIGDRGLAITGPIERFTQSLPALTPDDLEGVWRTVFLCVKAHHTETATRQLQKHLAADGVVVSLQNGFNELTIANVVGPERALGAFINFGADLVEPGVVHFGGRGAVVVGELDGRLTARADGVRNALGHFEPAAVVTDNIWGYLWGKMGYGAILFATALTNASIVEVLESPDARSVLTGLAREVTTVAAAEGVIAMPFNGYDPAAFAAKAASRVASPIAGSTTPPRDSSPAIDASFTAMAAFNRQSAKTHTGVWRDIAVHHRRTEAEAQFTPILAVARKHALPVPHLERLVTLIREVERGVRPQQWTNLAALGQPVGVGISPRGPAH